jgi:hypothetical protein
MSATPIDIWAENPRDFRLAGVKAWDSVLAKYVNDDTLTTLTAFIAKTNGPTASAAHASFSVTAVSRGRGKYQAQFTRAMLTYAHFQSAAIADGDTLYLIWDGPNDLRVEQPLTYHEAREAE